MATPTIPQIAGRSLVLSLEERSNSQLTAPYRGGARLASNTRWPSSTHRPVIIFRGFSHVPANK